MSDIRPLAPAQLRRTCDPNGFAFETNVWPVETVDQAVELLTGLPAGERGEDGAFTEGSVNRRADDRLADFAKKARAFGRSPATSGNSKAEDTEKGEAKT